MVWDNQGGQPDLCPFIASGAILLTLSSILGRWQAASTVRSCVPFVLQVDFSALLLFIALCLWSRSIPDHWENS